MGRRLLLNIGFLTKVMVSLNKTKVYPLLCTLYSKMRVRTFLFMPFISLCHHPNVNRLYKKRRFIKILE